MRPLDDVSGKEILQVKYPPNMNLSDFGFATRSTTILGTFGVVALAFADPEVGSRSAPATIQGMEAPISVGSPYKTDELTITIFDEAVLGASGPFHQEFASILAAANLVETENFPVFDKGWTVIAGRQDGGSIVDSYHAVQAYDFGADSTLSLEVYLRPRETPAGEWVTKSSVFSLSSRAEVGNGEDVVIGGLAVPGNYPRLVVFKVLGPSLAAFGIEMPLANPRVTLFRGNERVLHNDDWGALRTFETWQPGNICDLPGDPNESMIVTYLDPGLYTAVVNGETGESGVALLEMYLVDHFWIETSD